MRDGPELYRIADLTVDVGAARVERDAHRIELPALSFDTLAHLLRRAPDVVAADELIEAVWRGVAVSDETVVQRIALLRKALGDDSRDPRYVRSLRGKGYQLVPPVVREDRRRENGPELGPSPTGVPAPGWTRARALAAAGIAAVAILGLLTVVSHRGPRGVDTETGRVSVGPSPSAAELVSRGLEYVKRHREADNELAVTLFRQALERAPEHPAALTGLSLALSHRVSKFNQPPGWAREARKLAEKALELDPDDAEGHHALGLALDSLGRIGPALDAYRRAVALDERHAAARASAAYLLFVRGDLDGALEWNLRAAELGADVTYLEVQIAQVFEMMELDQAAESWYEKALALKPDNLFAHVSYASMRLTQGRFDEALELIRAARSRGVRRPELDLLRGMAALLAGDRPAARRAWARAAELGPGRSEARHRLLMLAYPASSQDLPTAYPEAVSALESSRRQGNEWPTPAFEAALLHSVHGRVDAALAALDEAVELGYRNADWLLLDPMLEGVRRNPGFWSRIENLRRIVAEDREAAQAADWWPADLLPQPGPAATAGRM